MLLCNDKNKVNNTGTNRSWVFLLIFDIKLLETTSSVDECFQAPRENIKAVLYQCKTFHGINSEAEMESTT